MQRPTDALLLRGRRATAALGLALATASFGCPSDLAPQRSAGEGTAEPPPAGTAAADPPPAASPPASSPRRASAGLESPLLLDPRRVPRRPDGLEQTARRRDVSAERMLERYEGTELVAFDYQSDALTVRGYVAAPLDGAGRLPCIIYNRGGNHALGSWNDLNASLFLAPLAQWGYVVIASQYRGTVGAEGHDEFGGAEVADVLNLIPVLESIPRADASRIGMYGVSRGGMMTYLALTQTDRIAAAVIHAGVANAFDAVARRPQMETKVYAQAIPRYHEQREQALRARSPVFWADRLDPDAPILLLHGTEDWRVDPRQSLDMAAALQEIDHPYRLVVYEGGGHSLRNHGEDVRATARAWLDRYVRDGAPIPTPPPDPFVARGHPRAERAMDERLPGSVEAQ